MTVAIEVESLDKGGLEEVVFDLVMSLDAGRFRPLVACVERGGAVAERLRARGVQVEVLGGRESAWSELLRAERVDLVNSHYARFGVEAARRLGIPSVHVLHNSYIWLNERGAARFSLAFARMERFVAVSSSVAEYARRRFGIPSDRLEVVPNGIRFDRLARTDRAERRARVRTALGLDDDAQLFLHVGSFEPRKGQHALIEAFAELARRHPRASLVCVGNRPDEAFFARCVGELGARGLQGRVHLQPHSSSVSDYYSAADAFVLPSVVEGFSLASIEALAFGLPLLLTDVGGARDVLADARFGVLLPPWIEDLAGADPAAIERIQRKPPRSLVRALTEAMEAICLAPDAWRSTCADRVGFAEERFAIERVVDRYGEIFEAVAARGCLR